MAWEKQGIGESFSAGEKGARSKAIDPRRDALQSRVLVAVVVPVLAVAAFRSVVQGASPLPAVLLTNALCVAFGLLVWRIRSATAAAAAVGTLVCVILAQPAWLRAVPTPAVTPQGMTPQIQGLIVLFVLTFAATRFGRTRKERHGLAEPRTGRRASQVVANLGVAALCGALMHVRGDLAGAACLAALAEATADTLSSEVGQAVGGTACMLTTLRRVPPGTDGGISLRGTLAGLAGAAAVASVAGPHRLAVFAAATVGLLFDSWLGATVERAGWLGNDLVNFSSTGVAAAALWLFRHWG